RCGRTVDRVAVNRHGGLTSSEGPASPELLLLVSLAGDRAELLTPGCVGNLGDIDVDSKDRADIDLVLNLIASGPIERDFILEDASLQVDALLLENRNRLDRLARQLLRRGHLNGHEVHL